MSLMAGRRGPKPGEIDDERRISIILRVLAHRRSFPAGGIYPNARKLVFRLPSGNVERWSYAACAQACDQAELEKLRAEQRGCIPQAVTGDRGARLGISDLLAEELLIERPKLIRKAASSPSRLRFGT